MKACILGLSFVLTTTASCFVNKYVLSILKFTFPTIFQGWQCLVSLTILVYIMRNQNIIIKIKRCLDFHYLPEVIFYVCSIYAGSKALSKLPVPIFLGFQNLTTVAMTILKTFLLEERPKNQTVFSEMVLLGACVLILNNEQASINPVSYFWMFMHIVSSGFCMVFEHINDSGSLDHEGTLIVNNLFAFLSLAPCTFLFGDYQAVKTYPHLYFSKFYISVIFSGLFNAISSALFITLINQDMKTVNSQQFGNSISGYTALSRIVAATLSQAVFERISYITVLWCVVACLVVPAIQSSDATKELSPQDSNAIRNHLV